MEQKKYFEVPVQVVFWDTDSNHWVGGIAYRNEVICGCCGGIVDIEEIYEYAPAEIGDPIREYDSWVDIEDSIVGGEMPDSLQDEEYSSDEEAYTMETWYYADLQDENKGKVD